MTSARIPDEAHGADSDEQHLRLLGIAHYVMAVFDLAGCAGGVIYVAVASFLPKALERVDNPDLTPEMAGSISMLLVAVGIAIALFSVVMSALTAYAGWSLHKRRNRMLILVVSALHLISMPFGTILGVLTIIVMSRPRVTAEFEASLR